MLVGSFLAGVAFSHSMVGMTHAISHALGGVYHIPHGLANALVLPEVMAYNLDARLERYSDIAAALGITFPQIAHQGVSMLETTWRPDVVEKALDSFDTVRDWVDGRSEKVKGLATKALGSLGFVDQWFRKQAARAGIEKISTLNRQLAHLTGMPLNLRDAGVTDNLAKLEQVVATAMTDGAMLYNPVEPEREDVARIVEKLYLASLKPLPVTEADLLPLADRLDRKEMKNVFQDTETLYRILTGFYERLKKDPRIGPPLKKTNLCIQFVYRNPSAVITIDASKDDPLIVQGDYAGKPEVTMTMNADFAHRFWHGKANLVTALTRRQVIAKGNVPKTIKLLPILKPAYELYPRFLEEQGLGHLVMD
jgi:hypothetical protein